MFFNNKLQNLTIRGIFFVEMRNINCFIFQRKNFCVIRVILGYECILKSIDCEKLGNVFEMHGNGYGQQAV